MPRVDFYILEPDSQGDRLLLACRLTERIRAAALRILIHCPDREQARHLDRLLWTFRQDSFLPHGLIGAVDPKFTPVLIGDADSPDSDSQSENQALINLSFTIPDGSDRFARLCEPIDRDPAGRAAGRARFRVYRERGYPLAHHPLRL